MFGKLLIANRGDCACRIAMTCRRLGIPVASVHSKADRDALHVREIGESFEIGDAGAAEAYRDAAAILGAARALGADAVHPGIGFLSESMEFARAVEEAGLVFVGPRPATLAALADKARAKREARAAGLPVLPGSEGSADPAVVAKFARAAELPLMLKAVAGGGGRGLRVVRSRASLKAEIASAMREARSSFGRPDLMVERLVEGARHIEVQIAGDGTGTALHLYERDCTLQRRHQKVVEEAPAPGLKPALRAALLAAARSLARRMRYRGLGTVEFLVSEGAFHFLEVNPRLQVEHPVTEAITGLDLVELQLRIAAGEGLAIRQRDVACSGHAIEARVYSEDPSLGFAPSTGRIYGMRLPNAGVRVDAGVACGEEVHPYYDPMLAKVIAHGTDRSEALGRLRTAISDAAVLGVDTNLGFLRRLLARDELDSGRVDTGFIDRHLDSLAPMRVTTPTPAFAIAAAVALTSWRGGANGDLWRAEAMTGWRLGRGEQIPTPKSAMTVSIGAETRDIAFSAADCEGVLRIRVGAETLRVQCRILADGRIAASCDDTLRVVSAARTGETVLLDGSMGSFTAAIGSTLADAARGTDARESRVVAPVMGRVAQVNVSVGDPVRAGDVIIVQESMKMEFRVSAPCDGVITALACAAGDMLERGAFVVELSRAEPVPAGH